MLRYYSIKWEVKVHFILYFLQKSQMKILSVWRISRSLQKVISSKKTTGCNGSKGSYIECESLDWNKEHAHIKMDIVAFGSNEKETTSQSVDTESTTDILYKGCYNMVELYHIGREYFWMILFQWNDREIFSFHIFYKKNNAKRKLI